MKHFGTLYLFEWKKLLGKRIVWISFLLVLLMLAIAVFSPLFGGYYIDGKYMGTTYEMHQTDRAYAKTLNGRKIDQNLLEETIEAYRKIPKDLDIHYMATDEYQKYARPYSEIFVFLRQMTGMMTSELMYSWEPDENDLSAKRRAYLLSYWKEQRLSAGEVEFWSSLENQIKTPYIYQEHGGYNIIFSCYQGIGFFMLMLIGISFSVLSAFLLFAFYALCAFCLYGAEGFGAAYQFRDALCSDPLSCGQALLIDLFLLLIVAVFVSIFVMVLSELLQSGTATLAVSAGLLLLSIIVRVPQQYRVPAQIWNWLPWSFLAPLNVFGNYTLCVFGHYFTPWQAVPVLYLAAGVAIAALGKPVYQRFQVSGR